MKQAKNLILIFVLIVNCIFPPAAFSEPNTLFIYPKLSDPRFADESIDFIQCVQEDLGLAWEILSEPSLVQEFPRLDLTEKGEKMFATLHSSSSLSKDLGAFAVNQMALRLCEAVKNALENKENVQKTESENKVDLGIDKKDLEQKASWSTVMGEVSEKSWLEKNWLWLSVLTLGLGAGAYFLQKSKAEKPSTRTATVQYR